MNATSTFSKKLYQAILLILIAFVLMSFLNRALAQETQVGTQNNGEVQNNKVLMVAQDLYTAIIGDSQNSQTNQGALGFSFDLIGFLYDNHPASTKTYVQSIIERIQPESVYAAQDSSGFTSLGPLKNLWQKMLSISYFILTLTSLAVGFMIMFRKKINPQTVATVQNSIPRIIAVLILVNLSYAIVGFIIDMSTLITYILIAAIGGDFIKGGADAASKLREVGPFEVTKIGFFNGWQVFTTLDQLISASTGIGGNVLDRLKMFFIPGGTIIQALQGLLPLLGTIVVLIALLTTTFRLFFALLQSYVVIILSTIFAPIQLIFGALPGQDGFIKSWLKTVIANALVFPAVFALLLIAAIFTNFSMDPWNIDPTKASAQSMNTAWRPILMRVGNVDINVLIAIGILFITPKVPDAIKKALGADEGIAGSLGRELSSRIPIFGSYAKEPRQ